MTQEEKDLLLKDLCARLPYGVKVYGNYSYSDGDKIVDDIKIKVLDIYDIDWVINNIEIKPYLLPLSSMTYEQKEKYCQLRDKLFFNDKVPPHKNIFEYINFFYENNLDINGLIPMDLAINATGLNIY